jgi:hypothetical protein
MRRRLLRYHLLWKALYEINYEAANRPDRIETPIRGVLAILDEEDDLTGILGRAPRPDANEVEVGASGDLGSELPAD